MLTAFSLSRILFIKSRWYQCGNFRGLMTDYVNNHHELSWIASIHISLRLNSHHNDDPLFRADVRIIGKRKTYAPRWWVLIRICNCPGGNLSRGAIVSGGGYPGGDCPGANCLGGRLSGANCPGGDLFGASCPITAGESIILTATITGQLETFWRYI